MKFIYVITLCFTIFLSGCSEDKGVKALNQGEAQQLAVHFTQALIDKDCAKAYSFTSKEYQKEQTQQQLCDAFEASFEAIGISSRQFKIDSAKVTSDKAYDESVYFSVPLGHFKNEEYGEFDLEWVVYVNQEGNRIIVSGINASLIETENNF